MEPTGAAPEAHPSSTWRTTAWRVLRGAGKAFRTSSTVVGATVLVTAGVGAYVASDVKKKSLTLPDEFVLDLDLQACEVVEQLPPPFQRFGGWRQVLVRDLVDAFEEAGKDPRVKGVLAKLPDGQGPRLGGFAQVHELRSAITRFRLVSAERQVPCTAYADTFGSTQSYYLASSFQDVFLQPSGMVMCNGLASKVPFLRGLLDSWKVWNPALFSLFCRAFGRPVPPRSQLFAPGCPSAADQPLPRLALSMCLADCPACQDPGGV